MAAQSPTENTPPNWKRCNKTQNEPAKAEQEKKSTQFKVSETAKPILEEQALLKEKLKSQLTWKKDRDSTSLRRKAQPMVARPPSPGAQKQSLSQQSQQSTSSSSKPPSPPPARRRTNSPSSSFNAGTSRSSSPLAEVSPEFKRNIEKATRARLYLLQQVGPNSFMIGGDSPNHKFKVIIGPQTCTCGKPFCVHLLFVMLRVFKVTENDPLLWNNNLRNYEVEGLFSKFHARVNSRLAKNTSSTIKGHVRSQNRRTPPPSPIGSIPSSSEPSTSGLNKDEEEVCPICLLEMVEGESLTCCKGGCNNRLHQHCMEIWAVECKTRKERLNCPLCRRILTPDAAPFLGVGERSPKGSPLSPNRTVSPNVPVPLGPEEVITLPHSEPIPSEQIELARPWIQVLGENIVSCMFSREWSIRETALRRLSKDLDSILINTENRTTSMTSIEACCSLLSMMCGDPVYKVYVAALRTFRVMLGLTRYSNDEDKVSLQVLFRPVIETIMTKCSDGNRRISALSIKVLIEICKDQNGELALGRMLGQNQHQSLGGLGFMLTCILTTAHEYATWPWWLGRLCFLHRLLEEYIESFKLLPDSPEIYLENSVGVIVQEGDHIDGNEIYSDNMTRLMSVFRFAILAGQCSHTMVSKQAITILLCCTSLSAGCPSAFVHIKKLVSKLKPSQRSILQRRLATLSRTTSVETSDGDSPLSEVSAAILDNDIDESVVSESSSGYFSARRIESTSTADESENPSETELLQSLVESLKRPNFLCLNLPRNITSPTRDLESLDWSRSEGESPRLPAIVVDNKCQKKIEEEENEAVARAMEVSVQERGPQTIPSLRPSVDEDEMVIVYSQPESMEKAVNTKHLYMENIHWKKGDLLGTGAFSSCYAARDVVSGALMAVKQVSFCRNSKSEQDKVCQAILDEISLLGKLQHPHLIKCLGATKHTGHFNIFLEWMAGGSISMLLSKYGAFEQATLIRYTRQILQGVAYLHQNQVIHRDIKGANILVDSTGQNIRIADFGAAARLATQITGAGEFQGQLLGTIAFMAPEVLRGESYGRSCDVWSVGCLLVEMATGKPPWNAQEHSNHLALIFKIACATSPPEIPDSLHPAIRDVLLRCFEQKPEDRPPAMELLKHPLFTQVTRS